MNTRDLELVDNLTRDIKYECGDILLQYTVDFYTFYIYMVKEMQFF